MIGFIMGAFGGGYTPPGGLPLTGRTLDVFGDSITFGVNTTSGNSWPEKLAAHFGMTLTNHAVSGTTMENQDPIDVLASPNMQSRISEIPFYVEGASGLLGIAYLTNDVGLNYPDYNITNYAAAINVILDEAINVKGWPTARIFFVFRYFVTAFGLDNGYGAPTPADLPRYVSFNDTGITTVTARSVKAFDHWDTLSNVVNPVSHLDAYERHIDDYMHGLAADAKIAYYESL